MPRLVVFVEGKGDTKAVVRLVARLLDERKAFDGSLYLDDNPIRIGPIERVTGRKADEWLRKLKLARLRPDLGGVLLVLDGDRDTVEGRPFCSGSVAQLLAERARGAGAGTLFSVACVFAMREFESWLIGGIASLAGRTLPDGSAGVTPDATFPKDAEMIRGCKEWLAQHMKNGYNPTIHQLPLVNMLDLRMLRASGLRSFARLEHALDELVAAIRVANHVSTPMKQTSVRKEP